jgi:hypothetical protein
MVSLVPVLCVLAALSAVGGSFNLDASAKKNFDLLTPRHNKFCKAVFFCNSPLPSNEYILNQTAASVRPFIHKSCRNWFHRIDWTTNHNAFSDSVLHLAIASKCSRRIVDHLILIGASAALTVPVELTKIWASNGTLVDSKTETAKLTPLCYLVLSGIRLSDQLQVIDAFLVDKAHVNKRCSGRSALWFASDVGADLLIVEKLLQAHANVDSVGPDNERPLCRALFRGLNEHFGVDRESLWYIDDAPPTSFSDAERFFRIARLLLLHNASREGRCSSAARASLFELVLLTSRPSLVQLACPSVVPHEAWARYGKLASRSQLASTWDLIMMLRRAELIVDYVSDPELLLPAALSSNRHKMPLAFAPRDPFTLSALLRCSNAAELGFQTRLNFAVRYRELEIVRVLLQSNVTELSARTLIYLARRHGFENDPVVRELLPYQPQDIVVSWELQPVLFSCAHVVV